MSADAAQLASLREQIDLFLAGQPSDAGEREWVLAIEDKARILALHALVQDVRMDSLQKATAVFVKELRDRKEGK